GGEEPGGGDNPGASFGNVVVGGEPVAMRAVKSSVAAANMMWRAENNDLMKRMGDLRMLEGERGLWAKYYTGKMEMDAQDTNFSNKYKAYQIGYDTKVNENWTVGAALSYNDGTSSTSNVTDGTNWSNGHGDQKNIALGLYGSWKAKDGQYADIIVKASRLDNEYNMKFFNGTGTYDIDGDYKTWGTSISAEYGKRFEGDKGTYFEPSAELTYGHVAGKNYDANTTYPGVGGINAKMNVEQDSFDTLIGRIGLRVGQKLEQGSYFAKLALAHEFCGDFEGSYYTDGANGRKSSIDFGDTWYELQIGGTAKLSANSMLYADFQRSFGGDVTEKWRVDAGLRFTF
ncbi:MAG: autotransporter outer membrane beta-barrel domain-containing protein, partial [Phascolarctobacterium sp.]|nr:autotransporter outer membrane beta-barrel domain-containing protein [Phascolarctobacterium sp.]